MSLPPGVTEMRDDPVRRILLQGGGGDFLLPQIPEGESEFFSGKNRFTERVERCVSLVEIRRGSDLDHDDTATAGA